LEKLCAFNDPSFGHIQAWDNTLGQHLARLRLKITGKFAQ